MREYIFGHILYGTEPLEGINLVQQIVKIAVSLPGYSQWCRHQPEIHKRAEEWARCVETSRYFHYGSKSSTVTTLQLQTEPAELPWNEQQSQAAREKIRVAIAQMLTNGTLPSGTTARFKALVQHNISGSTLYRHRDLWHPAHLQEATEEPVEIPPAPPQLESGRAQSMEDYAPAAQSLFEANGCNASQNESLGDRPAPNAETGCNVTAEQLSIFEMVQDAAMQEAVANHQRIRREQQEQQHRERMQRYLESGDPILVAEAIAWMRVSERQGGEM